jgi:signal transduction histidine kinase
MKVFDIAVAVVLAALGVLSAVIWRSDVTHAMDARGAVLAAAVGLVLVVRRRWPLVTLAAATVMSTVYLLLSYPYGLILLALAVAVYTVARYLPLSTAGPASLVALLVLLTHLFTNSAALPGILGLIPATAWVALPFAIGVLVQVNRESAERARTDAVRQRVSDERLRVAQEVHDVVGHGLAAIKMQADIALHLLAKKPEQAEIALTAISKTSTEALDELRATLTVVRGTDRSPAPGLDRLVELRERMTQAGLQVRLEVAGPARQLSAAVDLAGYRVVQESLTNVLRHSEAKQATVRVDYENGTVLIAISNPVSHEPTGRAGFGIPGMRERVTALGGEFTAGTTPDGRFEVRASIPTGGGE